MFVSAKDPITALREILSFLRGIHSTDAVRSVCNMWLGSQSIWTADEEPSQVCDPNVFVTPEKIPRKCLFYEVERFGDCHVL
mgnify:FL=1